METVCSEEHPWRREESGARGPPELAAVHFAHKTHVLAPARAARCEMRPSDALCGLARAAGGMLADRGKPVLAHSPGGGDRRDLIELALGTAGCRKDAVQRFRQRLRRSLRADAVHRHDGEDPALEAGPAGR